jgi:hypothetical protein
MSKGRHKSTDTDRAKRSFRRLGFILAGVILAAIFFCLGWKAGLLDSRSIEEEFTAIDAELAIPDSENAAVHYRRFLTDPDNAAVLDDFSSSSPSSYFEWINAEPWASSEHPELAAELDKNHAFIQTLFDISQMQKARFPVYPRVSDGSRQMWRDTMRTAAFILSCAAAIDLAEGRTDAAYDKYRCQLQLARHLDWQPAWYYRKIADGIEAVALGNVRRAVMRDGITPGQLASLETIIEIARHRDEVDAEIAARVNRLYHDKELSSMSTVGRVTQSLISGVVQRDQKKRQRWIRLRRDMTRRATLILIALRRHKEETGTWPETLEQIQPKLSDEMLIDHLNNGPFGYRRDNGSFVFYSRGFNGFDERGTDEDWPIWPLKINKVSAGSAENRSE